MGEGEKGTSNIIYFIVCDKLIFVPNVNNRRALPGRNFETFSMFPLLLFLHLVNLNFELVNE